MLQTVRLPISSRHRYFMGKELPKYVISNKDNKEYFDDMLKEHHGLDFVNYEHLKPHMMVYSVINNKRASEFIMRYCMD